MNQFLKSLQQHQQQQHLGLRTATVQGLGGGAVSLGFGYTEHPYDSAPVSACSPRA